MKTSDDRTVFCNNMKKIRLKRGLSKSSMARIIGITVNSLSELENGHIPSGLGVSIVIKLAKYLLIKPQYLFIDDTTDVH